MRVQLDPALMTVAAIGLMLLGGFLWVWRRYAELLRQYADDRVDHERQLADLRADHAQDVKKAREQTVKLSRSSLLGNAVEQIAPMAPAFCERFSPSDARFLGAPIDYVIFDGLHRGEIDRVVFLEIKSGARCTLNSNEREVRRAIEEKRVEFTVLPLGQTPPGGASQRGPARNRTRPIIVP